MNFNLIKVSNSGKDMLSKDDAQKLMQTFISLRNKVKETNSKEAHNEFLLFERHCIEKFKYLVFMRTSKYKGFANYDDLNQDGLEALVKAMKNYDPKKGIFFYWAHQYIDTRIARNANQHTAIRFPLKFAKVNKPYRESKLPVLVDGRMSSEFSFENKEMNNLLYSAVNNLSRQQKRIVKLLYGIDQKEPLSINKISRKLKISRIKCIQTLHQAMEILKQYILI